jgi:hypothetical protein
MSNKQKNWSVSGCSTIIEPGEEEILLEWRCPENHAAELTEYVVGFEDRYIKIPHPTLSVELAFELLPGLQMCQGPDGRTHAYHINPNQWKKHPFQTAVKLVVRNNSDAPAEVWGTLKGQHHLMENPPLSIQTSSPNPNPVPAPVPEPVKENVMNIDDLSNSHDDIPAGSMPTLGVFKEELPEYKDGDIAPLHMDNRGRLVVAVGGMTEDAEMQVVRLRELEAELKSEAAQQATENALRVQKVSQKYALKSQKVGLKKSRSDAISDEAITRTNNRAKAVISTRRYAFFATLARWAAVAGAAITMTYLLA